MNSFKAIDKVLVKVFRAMTYVAGAIVFFVMFLTVLNVITRAFFNTPVFGTVEIVSYAALALAALTLAQNEMDEGNPVMTLVVDNMKPRVKAIVLAVAQVLCVVFYAVCTVRFYRDIFTTIAQNKLTTTLEMPMWIFYAFMFVGFLFLTLASALKACRNFVAFFSKTGVPLTEEEVNEA